MGNLFTKNIDDNIKLKRAEFRGILKKYKKTIAVRMRIIRSNYQVKYDCKDLYNNSTNPSIDNVQLNKHVYAMIDYIVTDPNCDDQSFYYILGITDDDVTSYDKLVTNTIKYWNADPMFENLPIRISYDFLKETRNTHPVHYAYARQLVKNIIIHKLYS